MAQPNIIIPVRNSQQDYEFKKRLNKRLADIYWRWGSEEQSHALCTKADRVANCSALINAKRCGCCGRIVDGQAMRCKDRLCPICAAIKSKAVAAQALEVVPFLQGNPFLLTLTVKNVPAENLGDTLDSMLGGWNDLRDIRLVRRNMTAWARTLEITYNKYRKDYHPHVHAIFYATDEELSKLPFWKNIWKTKVNLDYSPIIHIKPVVGERGAVREISKYVTKVGKILQLNDNVIDGVVRTLESTIYKRQLRSYGGQWSKVRRSLNQGDIDYMNDREAEDLAEQVNSEKGMCCGEAMKDVIMRWTGFEYEVTEVKPGEADQAPQWCEVSENSQENDAGATC